MERYLFEIKYIKHCTVLIMNKTNLFVFLLKFVLNCLNLDDSYIIVRFVGGVVSVFWN